MGRRTTVHHCPCLIHPFHSYSLSEKHFFALSQILIFIAENEQLVIEKWDNERSLRFRSSEIFFAIESFQ